MEYKFNTLKNTLIFSLILLLSSPLLAVEVENLYQYKVVVDNKSQKQQQRATQIGFIGVLEKVSGQQVTQSHPAIKQAYQQLSDYVLKYEFEETLYETYLSIRYQPQMVDAVLTQMALPIWGNRRPLTLIWLAIEENYQRALVTKEDFPQMFQLLETNSENTGLPIVLPLLDLEDRMHVTATDVWANFQDQIVTASNRYEPEVIVSARLYRNENSWQLDWQFTNYANFQLHQLSGDKFNIVGQLVGSVAERISALYAVQNLANETNTVKIRFSGVDGLTEIEHLKTRLRSFSQITEVDMTYARSDQIELALYLKTDLDNLKKALQLDPKFDLVFDPFNHDESKLLEYQWLNP